MTQRGRARSDTAGHSQAHARHGQEGGHDTAQSSPRHGAQQRASSQGHGGVHCALDPILTQCTVLSHYLDHCS